MVAVLGPFEALPYYIHTYIHLSIYLCIYNLWGPWLLFQFLNPDTVGRTPWTGDEPFARPLPTHSTTQTQINHTDIHVSSGMQTHDPSVRAGEDGSCLRPRGHRDHHVGPMMNYTHDEVGPTFVPYFYLSKLHFMWFLVFQRILIEP
jgi:hypothetical protein